MVVDDMNDSRFYEQLMVVVGMNDPRLSAQGCRCYEQLKVMDDINDSEL